MPRTETEMMTDAFECYANLSPETLYCDGEISHAEAMEKARRLNARLDKLFVEMGREVGESEAWDWWMKHRSA